VNVTKIAFDVILYIISVLVNFFFIVYYNIRSEVWK